MANVVVRLRSKREGAYATLALLLGGLLWVLIAWAIWLTLTGSNHRIAQIVDVYVVYGVLIALAYFVAAILYRATAFGNMTLLGPSQFPELHQMVVSGAQALGLEQTPKAFLFNSNGLLNAFARKILGGRYVFLTSALVDAGSDEQVRFVIGHELGHHAAGHLNGWLNFVKFPAHIVPFLMRAYSRSREYTCDSVGAYLSKDLTASRSALQMLGCGCQRLNQAMNCEAFMAQEAMVPPVSGFITEIFRTHPRLTRRVAAIRDGVAVAVD